MSASTAAAASAVRIFSDARFGSGSFDTSGALVGGTLGYNYQMGQAVFGLEGDGDWSNIRGSGTLAPAPPARPATIGSAPCAAASATPFDRFMPYVTGGAAFGDIKTSIAGSAMRRETKAGWTAGGGLEASIAGPWTAKVEYLLCRSRRYRQPPYPAANANFNTEYRARRHQLPVLIAANSTDM